MAGITKCVYLITLSRSSFKEVVTMARVYNFSAGPAVLPEEVLAQAASEMLDYQGCGMRCV